MQLSEGGAIPAGADERDRRAVFGLTGRDAVYLLLVVMIGAGVRLYHLGWQPLWLDEAFSEWASRQSFWYLRTVLPTFETNPPLYYALLKGWRAIFGDGEAALRLLSVLFGTMTIPVVFAMGRMLGGRRAGSALGLLAAAMFALSPIHVQYAQEARAYAMLVFGVALAMAGLMWVISHPARMSGGTDRAAADRPPAGKFGSLDMLMALGALALGLAVVMWSHDTGAFAVLALAVPGVFWWATDARRSPRALVLLVMAGAVAFALMLPYLGHLSSHLGAVNKSFWIAAPTWWTITDALVAIYGAPTREGFAVFLVLWALGCFAIHALWRRGMRSAALLLLSVGLLPVLLELAVSLLSMPIFLDRTLIYVNLPLYLAAAYGITQLPVRSGVAVAIAVGMFGVALGSHFRDFKKEPWNEISAYLANSLRQGEPVLLLPNYLYLPLEYYALRQKVAFRRVGVPEDWRVPEQPRRSSRDRPPTAKTESVDVTVVPGLIGDNRRLGLVTRRVELVDPKMLVQQEVLKTHRIVETRKFDEITVMIFESR